MEALGRFTKQLAPHELQYGTMDWSQLTEHLHETLAPKLTSLFVSAGEHSLKQINDLLGNEKASAAAVVVVATRTREDLVVEDLNELERYLATEAEFVGVFDITNPYAQDYIRNDVGNLITGITDETKIAIRDIIESGFFEGMTVAEMAREMRSYIGLNDRQMRALQRYADELGGLSPDTADRIRKKSEKMIRYRATMIARTETIAAANAGQRTAWRQAAQDGVIDSHATSRVWITTEGERTCEVCLGYDGKKVAFNEEFPSSDPPIHPLCRCTVGLVFEAPSTEATVEEKDRKSVV